MNKGYTEWVTTSKISFITNPIGRVLYMNKDWPDGPWEKWEGINKTLSKTIKNHCKKGRTFNKEELMLELL